MEFIDSPTKINEILLSIIIPVWNREGEISYCLESISGQVNVDQCEIIVVNDCSTDNTLKTLYKIIESTSMIIRIINNDRRMGAAASRNNGLKEARGQYIWFIDSDDYISKNAFKYILPQFQKKPDIIRFDKIHASTAYPDFQIPIKNLPSVECYNLQTSSKIMLFFLSYGGVYHSVFSRKIIGDIKFDESFSYGEDALFTWSIMLHSKDIIYIKAPLYVYMNTPGSLTQYKSLARFTCYIQLIEKFINLVDSSQVNNKTKKRLYNDCYWRLYSHAFGCYEYCEINDSMWEIWFKTYELVMVKNSKRPLWSRLISSGLFYLRAKRLFILIYKTKLCLLRWLSR